MSTGTKRVPHSDVSARPSLAKPIAQAALPLLEAAVRPVVEDVVMILAASSGTPIRIRTRRAPVKAGIVQPRSVRGTRTPLPVASACRMCGLVLEDPDRALCDECLPDYDRERTRRLSNAGKATLAAMRGSSDNPARSAEATAKKREKSRSTSLAMRAWEREHGKPEAEVYQQQILPKIHQMTVPQLRRVTSLSAYHLTLVRQGARRLHARHWAAVLQAAGANTVGGSR
jgi:hypothetical protein